MTPWRIRRHRCRVAANDDDDDDDDDGDDDDNDDDDNNVNNGSNTDKEDDTCRNFCSNSSGFFPSKASFDLFWFFDATVTVCVGPPQVLTDSVNMKK